MVPKGNRPDLRCEAWGTTSVSFEEAWQHLAGLGESSRYSIALGHCWLLCRIASCSLEKQNHKPFR